MPELFAEARPAETAAPPKLSPVLVRSLPSSLKDVRDADREDRRQRSRNLHRRICGALFSAFVKELGAKLTSWESDTCRRLCDQSELLELLKHFVHTEVHVQEGPLRREFLTSSNHEVAGERLGKLLAEREALSKHVHVAVSEETLVQLFIEHRLTWTTVKALARAS